MKISNRFAKSTVGRAFLFLAALLLTGLALAPGLADANGGGLANTPWPMFQHDQRHTGQSPYLGAQTNAIRWIFDAGQIIRGSPVIGSDGTIYFSCWNGSRFYALNPDGSVKWLRNTAYGGVGAPAIGSDGTIYFSDYGQMKAFNPDGSTKWTLNANGIRSSPVIADDGTIYAGANLAPDGGRLYAIRDNGSSGSVKWFYHTDGHINYSAPAIGNGGTIYIGTYDTDLYAITDNITNGVLKWRFNTGGLINSSPSIGSDGTIYVGSDDGALYAITDNVTNAVKKWHFGTGWSITSSPAIGSDGTIYVGCSAAAGFLYTLFAMNPDGSLKWAYDTGSDAETCSPAIGSDGTIYIGNGFGGRVWAISDNGTSGNLKWSYLTGDWVIGSPAIGSDGTVYIGSYDAKLYAFSSRPIITSANPSSGYQGTTLSNVIITGQNFTGATAVSFGAGITVNTFNVDGATQITANITIAADATPGTRDITVTIAEGPGTKINAFTVIQKGQNVYVNGATGNDSYDGLAAAWDSTHGPKKTIAGGIAAVTDNGTVNVAAGTYHEHGLHLSQTMNLVGAGALTTIIDGGANGNVLEVSSAPNQRNTISGFTIRNGAPAGPDPGGGIYISEVHIVTINDCAIVNNVKGGVAGHCPGAGGGVCNDGGVLYMNRCTVSGNTAGAQGGGIYSRKTFGGDSGLMELTNCTISGNQLTEFDFSGGAGIYNYNGTMRILNCTIAHNQTTSFNSAVGGGFYSASLDTSYFKNTIVANNTAGYDLYNNGSFSPPGSIVSQGYNLDSENSCGFNQPTDQRNTNPLLGLLQNNGGPTSTHAITTSSPAFNKGTCDVAPATDQRGISRPQGALCDIGAFELIYTVNTATGTGAATFATSSGAFTGLTASSSTACGTLTNITFPHGFFSFTITGITPGSTVTITITLPSAMPTNTQYWKCINGTWVDCTSLLGSNDGDNIITLTITDGGMGDADGLANGTIVDPGGPAVATGAGHSIIQAEGASTGSLPVRLAPPNLKPRQVSVSSRVTRVNQTVTVAADIVNEGETAGSTNVALVINGFTEQVQTLRLEPGAAGTVTFTVEKTKPGKYEISIGDQRASFLVVREEAKVSPFRNGLLPILLMGGLFLAVIVVLVAAFRRRTMY